MAVQASGVRNAGRRPAFRGFAIVVAGVMTFAVGCTDAGDPTGPGPLPAIGLTLLPASASVEQGGSVEVIAIVTRTGGFAGDASISVEGVPSGVTGTVDDVLTSGDVTTATVTIQADPGVALGTYDLILRSSGSGVADATADLALTVMAVPAYDLTLSPDTLTIEQGSVGTAQITLARTNLLSAVQLTVEDAPTGVTAVFDPTPATGAVSTLLITVDVTAAMGEFLLTVRGEATDLTDRTATLLLSVTSMHKVTFRLDDIQAHWCATTATEVIQLFVDKDVPLGLGIVGGDPWYVPHIDMAPDTPGGVLINRYKNEPTIRLLSHSYNHTDLTSMTEQEQRTDFENQQRVLDSFGITPAGFIPPENAYNASTISLMKDFGMNVLSAQCTWSSDQPPLAITCPSDDRDRNQPVDGVTHIPAGAVLGDNNWEDLNSPISWDAAQDWASRQLTAQQLSVFMIHPQELTSDGACSTDSADAGKMATLSTILDQAKLTWSLLSVDEMQEYLISR